MTAEELYEVYQAANGDQNVMVDAWDDLEEVDQIAWQAVADHVDKQD